MDSSDRRAAAGNRPAKSPVDPVQARFLQHKAALALMIRALYAIESIAYGGLARPHGCRDTPVSTPIAKASKRRGASAALCVERQTANF